MLLWSKETPVEAGWYWWRLLKTREPRCVHVRMDLTNKLAVYGIHGDSVRGLYVTTVGGEWAGPLPEPKNGDEPLEFTEPRFLNALLAGNPQMQHPSQI
jgi:hypothetical protein